MASRIGPRSVKDATRFTSTVPHATSKFASPSAAAPKPSARIPGETPEQRVRRLRQAHLAAQKAQISRTDKAVDVSRRILDVAHKWTVGGLVIFTVIAGAISIYSVWDMLRYNRARRAEWLAAQKKIEADELATARLAYLKGDATEEQIALVEEANREAKEKGFKLPPLLSPPEHRTHFEEHVKPALDGSKSTNGQGQGQGMLGIFFSNKKAASEDEEKSAGAAQAVESTAGHVQDLAKDAWGQERQNQRHGGSLDQLGLESGSPGQAPEKKGWWPW